MHKILLENIEFHAYHGCYAEEQLIGNRFLVNIELTTLESKACMTDNVADTVSYLDVFQTVKREMMIPSAIMEHVCKRILDAIAKEYPAVVHTFIKMSKMNPPLGGKIECASIMMEYPSSTNTPSC